MNHYHLTLSSFGDQSQLSIGMDNIDDFIQWTELNFEYVKYNPRKDVNRYGLSITSLDGGVSGIPDLDSLREYNKENNVHYREQDFTCFTPVSKHPELKKLLDPFRDYIFRTHILKLKPGGFFPPHRDFTKYKVDSCRLIIPLKNISPPSVNFIIEDQILNWESGKMYFVNTAKLHSLANSSFNDSYWIVINCRLDEYITDYIISKM